MLARTPSSTRTAIGAVALATAAALFAPPGSKAQTSGEWEAAHQAYINQKCPTRDAGCTAAAALAHLQLSIKKYDASIAEHQKAIAKSDTAIAKSDAAIAEHSRAIDAAKKSIADSDAKIAEHQKATAEALAQGQCARDITGAILGGRVTREEVLNAKRLPTETGDLCEVKRRLYPRFGELSKQ